MRRICKAEKYLCKFTTTNKINIISIVLCLVIYQKLNLNSADTYGTENTTNIEKMGSNKK